ncbi:MAG: hypothetical protein CFE25_03070 [Chitinophagaceae bacterium BSSC1]|nr:MAG: hypothetical protein CFE25_03070 [Chitinophagaceae bacterium BSSC1]
MKRIWNILLLLSFLFGYLQWGKDQHLFLFQAIGELYTKAKLHPMSVLHPLTLLPFIGMLLFLSTIFQKTPSRIITFAGAIGMSSIMLMILLIGILGPNFKMLLSVLPFFTFLFFVVKTNWRKLDI